MLSRFAHIPPSLLFPKGHQAKEDGEGGCAGSRQAAMAYVGLWIGGLHGLQLTEAVPREKATVSAVACDTR